MARVNVDIGVVQNDPRWKVLCRDTSMTLPLALGHAMLLWGAAYDLRSPVMSEEHVDLASLRAGFARELVHASLADETPEGIRIRGVEERIEYLLTQHERGRKGGLASAQARAQRPLNKGNGSNTSEPVASGALKPPLALALVLPPEKKPSPGYARHGMEAQTTATVYVEWFNRNFHREFTARQDLVKMVAALLVRKYTLEDMKAVSWVHGQRWSQKPEMREYVVPASLLRPSKFGGRLDEANEIRKKGGVIGAAPSPLAAREAEIAKLYGDDE